MAGVITRQLIIRNSALTQTAVTTVGSGLSAEQDTLLREISPKLSTVDEGVKKRVFLFHIMKQSKIYILLQ